MEGKSEKENGKEPVSESRVCLFCAVGRVASACVRVCVRVYVHGRVRASGEAGTKRTEHLPALEEATRIVKTVDNLPVLSYLRLARLRVELQAQVLKYPVSSQTRRTTVVYIDSSFA
eukprot:scaffold375_cov210-Pinguiococcus_pyrenoidosus.AAC.6